MGPTTKKKKSRSVIMLQTASHTPRDPSAVLDFPDTQLLCKFLSLHLGLSKSEVVLEFTQHAACHPWPWPVLLLAHPNFSRLRFRPLQKRSGLEVALSTCGRLGKADSTCCPELRCGDTPPSQLSLYTPALKPPQQGNLGL